MSDTTETTRVGAYQLWQEQGEPEGKDTEHWLRAEWELQEGGKDNAGDGANEGEGSQTGARTYDEATTAFAHNGKVAGAAADAVKAFDNPAEAADMKAAERSGEGIAAAKTRRWRSKSKTGIGSIARAA
jgi:hypothetical protein